MIYIHIYHSHDMQKKRNKVSNKIYYDIQTVK